MHHWSEADFYQTGEADAKRFLDTFCAEHGIRTKSRVVLEIGCGAGRVSHALATRFKRVIALDVSDEMLNVARAHVTADNVQFVQGNGVNLDVVSDGAVSFVFSTMVFQHIPDAEVQYTLLREVGRVLRPNGWYWIHLYADQARYERLAQAWAERAASGTLNGWSEAALPELQDDNYKTSMCTPVDNTRTREVLSEAGLALRWEEGAQTNRWIIAGQKEA